MCKYVTERLVLLKCFFSGLISHSGDILSYPRISNSGNEDMANLNLSAMSGRPVK